MRSKTHVRFLGGGAAATPSCYPTEYGWTTLDISSINNYTAYIQYKLYSHSTRLWSDKAKRVLPVCSSELFSQT